MASITRVCFVALAAAAAAAVWPCDSTATLSMARSGTICASPTALAEMLGGPCGGGPACALTGTVTRVLARTGTARTTARKNGCMEPPSGAKELPDQWYTRREHGARPRRI